MILDLRRTGAISAGLHGIVLLALLLTLKPPVVVPPEPTAVTMEFATAPGEVQRAQKAAPTPAPSPAEVPTPDLPSLEPPKPTPTEAPAPPPPPPLPPTPSPQAAPVPTPPIPPPPAQPSAPSAPVSVAPAPTPAAEAPLPVPPVPPPPAPAPPKPAVPQAAPAAPKPDVRPPAARPAPERPTPTQRTTSTTSQQNPTKNTADDSKTLEATLERLRSLQAQTAPPTRTANPPRGGAPGGGSPNGVDNAKLSGADRGAIGDRIRECYSQDTGGRDYAQQWALIRVTTDGSGVVRQTDIVGHSAGQLGTVFAERAARAARDPQCAKLPLPNQLLGQTRVFEINFKP